MGRHDLRLLWFALHHRSRPAWLWPVAVLLGLYAFEPFNFAIPLLGAVDDLAILPLLLHLLLKLLPLDVRAGFRQKSSSPSPYGVRRFLRTHEVDIPIISRIAKALDVVASPGRNR
jgi:uncharacterized membrane protein YkvA (DUF1232 family)